MQRSATQFSLIKRERIEVQVTANDNFKIANVVPLFNTVLVPLVITFSIIFYL